MKLAGAYIHDDTYERLAALAMSNNRTLAGQCRHLFERALKGELQVPDGPALQAAAAGAEPLAVPPHPPSRVPRRRALPHALPVAGTAVLAQPAAGAPAQMQPVACTALAAETPRAGPTHGGRRCGGLISTPTTHPTPHPQRRCTPRHHAPHTPPPPADPAHETRRTPR